MMLEIFISFLILFVVWSLSVYTYRNYVTPAGLSTDNVWTVYLDFNTENDTLRRQYKDLIRQHLNASPEVVSHAFFSNNIPFGNSTSNTDFSYNGNMAMSNLMFVDESLPDVLGLSVASGTWFRTADTLGGTVPVVITRHLARELFGNDDPIGKILTQDNSKKKVVGVMDHYRHKSSFQEDDNSVLLPAGDWENTLLVKLKPEANNADYEAKLDAALHQLGKDWTIEIQHLDNMKSTQDKLVLIPLLILAIVCGFLIFNVGLGLFGVLFQNISRRKGEIGIRRAMGATQSQVWRYFVGETLVIASFGVALGIFFAVQIPLLHVLDVDTSVYTWGILLAALSIYLLAIICSFYPSRQAAAIFPAVALHEE